MLQYTAALHSTLQVYILQIGMRPIHYAAQEGHENIVMILLDEFDAKPDAVTRVCMYVCSQLKHCVIMVPFI